MGEKINAFIPQDTPIALFLNGIPTYDERMIGWMDFKVKNEAPKAVVSKK